MRAHRFTKRALAVLITALTVTATTIADADTTIAQKVAVPAYFHPLEQGDPWGRLAASTSAVGIAVANVLNGPSYPESPDYATVIQAAHNAGIKVIGYVDTGYSGTTGLTTRTGSTSAEAWRVQIQQDVNRWYEYYGDNGLDGIFFDQMTNVCGTSNANANFYKSISEFVKFNHLGAVTAANPGIGVPQCYQNSADILLTFEGTFDCYDSANEASEGDGNVCPVGLRYASPGWDPVDPKKFWHLVYSATSGDISNAISLSKMRKAGYIYVTDDGGSNPWNTLPASGYWSSLQTAAAPGGSTPDTTAPSVPQSLDTVAEWYTWLSLDWVKSTDSGGSGVVAYDLFQGSNQIWSVPATSSTFQTYTVNGLQPGTWYTLKVRARDGSGNVSALSSALTVETEPADGSAPTKPGSPASSNITYTTTGLSWTASTDADDTIVAYDIYRDGARILQLPPSTTSTTVVGLPWGTTQALTIKARDSEGNSSVASNTVNVTTLSMPGGGWINNAAGSYTVTTLTYSAQYVLPFAFQRVFIDADNNASTGYSAFEIGSEYVIDGGTLYRHTGTFADYPSTPVTTATPSISGSTYTWTVAVSSLTSPATTQKVVFQGDGDAPSTYTNPPLTLIRN